MCLFTLPCAQFGFNKLLHAAMEAGRIELQGVIANSLRIKHALVETYKRFHQALDGLLTEEHARHTVNDRGQRSTCSIGNHMASGGLRFDGCDTEIFFAREHEGAALGVVVNDL